MKMQIETDINSVDIKEKGIKETFVYKFATKNFIEES